MTTTMRRFLTIPILMAMAACAGGAERRFLSMGTAPPGGAFFVVGGAIAEVLNEHAGETAWEVTAEATKGSRENIRRLESGELDLALSNSAITYFAVRGEAGWERPQQVRTVMTLAPNVALFIAPAGGEIRTLRDLPGRRVYVGPAGAGFDIFLRPLLEAHGVSYDDLDAIHGTQASAVDMLGDGAVGAAFLGGAVPTASITQATASQDIAFLPFDDAAVDALTERYLFFGRATIRSGTYRGQTEDFRGLDVGSMHLITSTSADEALIYEVTKAIWENRAEITAKHAAGRAIREPNVVRDTGTEFHPGAIRYYREIGIWPSERSGG